MSALPVIAMLDPNNNPLVRAAARLRQRCAALSFPDPVSHVYNPLDYAWSVHEAYLKRFGSGRKRIVFLGMNPGPFGMMQTGVPFGEVAAVRDWMGLSGDIERAACEHPKRPILGFECRRSEVSGRRLWGWAAERFGSAEAFFSECFVLNYCPLVFLEASGRNHTPEQMPASATRDLDQACDEHLRAALEALNPEWAIGIGGFAARRLAGIVPAGDGTRVIQVLHPSPASPAANRGWASAVDATLAREGVLPTGPLHGDR